MFQRFTIFSLLVKSKKATVSSKTTGTTFTGEDGRLESVTPLETLLNNLQLEQRQPAVFHSNEIHSSPLMLSTDSNAASAMNSNSEILNCTSLSDSFDGSLHIGKPLNQPSEEVKDDIHVDIGSNSIVIDLCNDNSTSLIGSDASKVTRHSCLPSHDSIDDLLDDLSRELSSPGSLSSPAYSSHQVKVMTTPLIAAAHFDSILTGYITPDSSPSCTESCGSGHNAAPASSKWSRSLTESDSTTFLFDVKTHTNSELSLFDVKSLTLDQTPSLLKRAASNMKSTPLSGNDILRNITVGNFDIIPQLSALNFTD